MSYFLGVDVGGTKTHAMIATEKGETIGFGEAGAGNHESVGYDGLTKALNESTSKALENTGLKVEEITAGGFGVAGYDWPSERQDTLNVIATLGLICPVEAVNDAVVGLLAGAEKGWGVGVDAGTGDNCWGRDWDGKEAHMTGCGPAFGEYGGAGSLVFRAMQAVSYEWGHRGPKTKLSDMFLEAANVLSLDDLLEGLSQGRFWFDADLAPRIFQVAEAGDQVAKECIAWDARELASSVNGIIRQLHFEALECDVVMIGSMFKGGDLLIEPFKAEVRKTAPAAKFVKLNVPPVVGGVILAMELAGIKADAGIRSTLNASVQKILVG